MNLRRLWYRFREWRHQYGHHSLCRDVEVVDHFLPSFRELIAIKGADGSLEFDDVTNQSSPGHPVYKTVHG